MKINVFHAENRYERFEEIHEDRLLGGYTLVGAVEGDHPFVAYDLTADGRREYAWSGREVNEIRSTSVGDILEADGVYYGVDKYGFSEVKFEDGIIHPNAEILAAHKELLLLVEAHKAEKETA